MATESAGMNLNKMNKELAANTNLSHYRIVSKINRVVRPLRDGKPTLFSRGATTKDVVLISGFRK